MYVTYQLTVAIRRNPHHSIQKNQTVLTHRGAVP